jgi:hypothetical protein
MLFDKALISFHFEESQRSSVSDRTLLVALIILRYEVTIARRLAESCAASRKLSCFSFLEISTFVFFPVGVPDSAFRASAIA